MLKIIILGIIQGLTEFLPVSSSGHLVLIQHFLNNNLNTSNLSLEVFLHLGSLLAVIIYFKIDILTLILSLFNWDKTEEVQKNHKTILFLIISTLITGFIGIIFKKQFELVFDQPILVSILIFVTGFILLLSDKISNTNLKLSELGILKSIFIGFGQSIAILPGISRSGTTIVFSLISGLKREEAARFSFLLSIPAIIGANILEIKNIIILDQSHIIHYILGLFSALISGLLVIKCLLSLIKKSKLKYFAYYCFIISSIALTMLLFGF